MSDDARFVVEVRGNLVGALRRDAPAPETEICLTPLEASTLLAERHRRGGCIDGDYWFADPEHARSFAVLCLDFTVKRAERSSREIDALDVEHGDGWHES